jgi:hypothetical protein
VSPLSLVPPLPSSLGPLLKRSGPTARAAGLCHGMKIGA